MSCGKSVVKEDLDAARPARCEQRMLRDPGQGEKDGVRCDCVAQHVEWLVVPFHVTPWGDRSPLCIH